MNKAVIRSIPVGQISAKDFAIFKARYQTKGSLYQVLNYFDDHQTQIQQQIEKFKLHKSGRNLNYQNLRNLALVNVLDSWQKKDKPYPQLIDQLMKKTNWDEGKNSTSSLQRTLKSKFSFIHYPFDQRFIDEVQKGQSLKAIAKKLRLVNVDKTLTKLSVLTEHQLAIKRLLKLSSKHLKVLAVQEIRALFFFLEGKQAKDIAQVLKIKNLTVTNNLMTARKKIGLSNLQLHNLAKIVQEKLLEAEAEQFSKEDIRLIKFLYNKIAIPKISSAESREECLALIKEQINWLTKTQRNYLLEYCKHGDVSEVAKKFKKTDVTIIRILKLAKQSMLALVREIKNEYPAKHYPASKWFTFKKIDRDLIRDYVQGYTYRDIRARFGSNYPYVRESYLNNLFKQARKVFSINLSDITKLQRTRRERELSSNNHQLSFYNKVFNGNRPIVSQDRDIQSDFEETLFDRAMFLLDDVNAFNNNLLLRYIQGMTPKEIGDYFGLERKIVQGRLGYAKKRLKESLQTFICKTYITKKETDCDALKVRYLDKVVNATNRNILTEKNLLQFATSLLNIIPLKERNLIIKPYLQGYSSSELAKFYGEEEAKIEKTINEGLSLLRDAFAHTDFEASTVKWAQVFTHNHAPYIKVLQGVSLGKTFAEIAGENSKLFSSKRQAEMAFQAAAKNFVANKQELINLRNERFFARFQASYAERKKDLLFAFVQSKSIAIPQDIDKELYEDLMFRFLSNEIDLPKTQSPADFYRSTIVRINKLKPMVVSISQDISYVVNLFNEKRTGYDFINESKLSARQKTILKKLRENY